ncbi:Stomatin-like protein 2 [Penicillium angulare]|uniref:Stomatin-like protein 2 n=1 Tax=Penicillium angulare TaxID=116970 RepID=A0A9W9G8P0_9EURO|nr:Stomatin-like protein 2 [Penicillium angulare]
MEGASRQTSRILRSRGTNVLSQHARLPRPATQTGLTTTQCRALSNSNRNLAPESLLSQFAAASSGSQNSSGSPAVYFNNRSTLPANTVVRFVPQQTAWIVERMGKFHRILEPGLAILVPFLDRIAYVRSLKESALEIPSQNAITADNVTLELDGVLYTRVFDAYKASYGVEDAEYAISQLAQTTMRSEIGQLTLDHVLKERATLNTNITQAINEAAQDWGVVCLRYEIRDIHAPDGVVAAMHRQVTAERSKRAEILDSEGQRQSAINIAEGRKQSVILASEALRAEAINKAAGESEAIQLRAQATARGIEAVARAIEDGKEHAQGAISLSVAEKYVDAFSKLAKEGTSVVVPGNVGDLGGMIANAMAVYGKVSQSQAKSMAAKAIGVPESEINTSSTATSEALENGLHHEAESSEAPNSVSQSVLDSFDEASQNSKH